MVSGTTSSAMTAARGYATLFKTPRDPRGLDIPYGGSILKLMEKTSRKPLLISRRLPNGWSNRIENKDPHQCDLDGARLWIGPGDQVYCDLVHDPKTADQVSTPRRAE
jgi:hypothetical protein